MVERFFSTPLEVRKLLNPVGPRCDHQAERPKHDGVQDQDEMTHHYRSGT